MSFLPIRKIRKVKQEKEATELEKQVAQAIFDLEVNSKDLKTELQPLYFHAAREIKVGKTKKALIIIVPIRFARAFRKIQVRLVRELEKKFVNTHVAIIPLRKTQKSPETRNIRRPYKKTLKAVQDAYVEDVCFPVEVVGKRTRFLVDGTEHLKVSLDPKDKINYDSKKQTFAAVYRALTGKSSVFEFQ